MMLTGTARFLPNFEVNSLAVYHGAVLDLHKSMKVTIRHVAEAAGVSAMAVSKVLHGTVSNVRVSEATAERIKAAAKTLNYRQNLLARSLRFRKTSTVGVVFQHFDRFSNDNPYHPMLLNGIMAGLFEADYTLALCPKLVQRDDSGAIWDGRFDGVLWARPDFTEASVELIRNSSVPLVMMHAPPGSAMGVSTFCADNDHAMQQVVRHLCELGHRNMTFVVDRINQHTAEGRARSEAFLSAVRQEEVFGEVWIWDEDPHSLKEYCQRNPQVAALSAYSDLLAFQLLNACSELGIQVPQDISLVGFDSSTFCERSTPRLTSVNQAVETIAYEATTHLLDQIRADQMVKERPSVTKLYRCDLDVRDSTGPPPSENS